MKNTYHDKTIYLFRHGEGMDDVNNLFGGWSDLSLSKNGSALAKQKAQEFKKKNIDFKIILTSPLKRACESANILSKLLKIPTREYAYLKERNTYGILGGLSKTQAKKEYPELIKKYNAQEFIPGAERYDDFKNRIDTLLTKLRGLKYKSILCVTHGYVITTIMEEFLSLNRKDITDGSYIGLKLIGGKFDVIESSGITYSEGGETYDSKRYRKFKR
jgi:broad specificity phosphatase PhoE